MMFRLLLSASTAFFEDYLVTGPLGSDSDIMLPDELSAVEKGSF